MSCVDFTNQTLTKKIFDLEIKAIKLTEKIKLLGEKLKLRTEERDRARKDLKHAQKRINQMNDLPVVRSKLLNVSYSFKLCP